MTQVQGIGKTALQPTILPILVLYYSSLEGSTTYQTFLASSRRGFEDPVLMAVYDNSPVRQVGAAEEAQLFAYQHDPNNGGLAAAYNWALNLALANQFTWLLLLDQDSELPDDFLAELQTLTATYAGVDDVVAVLPRIRSNGAFISPNRVRFARLSALQCETPAVYPHELTAINSGAAVKVSFLRSLDGFNSAYWLDYLDHWLFRQVYATGKKVAVSQCILEHNLSVLDYRHRVSTTRYRSILAGEALFVTTYKSHFEVSVYLIRLLVRSLKQGFVVGNWKMAAMTAAMVLRIALHPTRGLETLSSKQSLAAPQLHSKHAIEPLVPVSRKVERS